VPHKTTETDTETTMQTKFNDTYSWILPISVPHACAIWFTSFYSKQVTQTSLETCPLSQ